jgi:predicted PurR-regulated permease PerM
MSGLQTLQGALLVVAILYFARDLLIPLVLAVLLSFVLAPLVRLQRGIGVPRVVAVLGTVLLAAVLLLGAATLVGQQAGVLAENLPGYQATVMRKLEGLRDAGGLLDRLSGAVQDIGRSVGPTDAAAPRPQRDAPLQVEIHDPAPTPFDVLRRLAEPLVGPLATAGIVGILVIFILLYRADLRDRLIRLVGARDLHRTMAAMDDAAYRLSRFFLAQTGMNLAYGSAIGLALWLIGIPNPLLWGFLAGLMRFVPFIGSFIAAGFPALLALAVDPGWGSLGAVVALFAISEGIMGQVLEPLVFGHSTGLSPVAIIGAATVWTWLWGPVGLLLSVPLTVCLVVLGRHVDRLEFLEVILGDRPALDPEETFYQRALAGDADALSEQAERCLKDRPLAVFLDQVALPGLRLAQQDAGRGLLEPERRAALDRSLALLIEDLAEAEDPKPAAEKGVPKPAPEPGPAPGWRAPGAVLCLPGRGPLDPQVAAMLVLVLERRGFGVAQGGAQGGVQGGVQAGVLGGARGEVQGAVPPPGGPPPRLLVLCLLDGGGSTATARYLLRRARRRLPGVPVVALAWGAEAEAPLPMALRAEPPAPAMAASMVEVLDLVTEAAARPDTAPAEVAAA